MILPLSDIISISKHRSYRIGYSGLIVVIKGHEEIFFEMRSLSKRDECVDQLEKQIEFVHYQLEDSVERILSPAEMETQDLLSLVRASHLRGPITTEELLSGPHPLSEASSASQPPIMFCSTSSDFITFRPEKSLRFTCLTIGSRGDVQPYIALCKGLIDQGHTCKIASHGEYRSWVEGHGIEFEEIGGDPAELMQREFGLTRSVKAC